MQREKDKKERPQHGKWLLIKYFFFFIINGNKYKYVISVQFGRREAAGKMVQ